MTLAYAIQRLREKALWSNTARKKADRELFTFCANYMESCGRQIELDGEMIEMLRKKGKNNE